MISVHRGSTRSAVATTAALATSTVVVGLALADDTSMTVDESLTAHIIDRPLTDTLRVLWDGHVGMWPYHLVLWCWARMGDSDLWLRSLSVLGGAAAVALLHRLLLRWMEPVPALAACVLLIVNPFFLRYLVDARSYAWAIALGVLTVRLLDDLMRQARARETAALGGVVGVGILNHTLSALFAGAVFAGAAVYLPLSRARKLVTPLAIAAATASPIVVATYLHPESYGDDHDVSPFRIAAVTSSAWGGTPVSIFLAGGVTLLLLDTARSANLTWPATALISAAAGPPALLALVAVALGSSMDRPLLLARYLAPTVPFVIAAAVAGFTSIEVGMPARFVGAAALAIGVFLSVLAYANTDRPESDGGARAIAAHLEENAQPGDAVLFEPSFLRLYVGRYWGFRPELDVVLSELDDSRLHPVERARAEYEGAIDTAPSVWLVTAEADPDIVDELRGERDLDRTEDFGFARILRLR